MRAARVEMPSGCREPEANRRAPLVSLKTPDDAANCDDRRLGMIGYGTHGFLSGGTVPCCSVPLPVLHAAAPVCIWNGARKTVSGTFGGVDFRCDGETMLGTYTDPNTAPDRVEAATETAYRALFEAARFAGYPHVYRIWNYLPDINRETGGLEVYKAFCIGRQRVFDGAPLPAGAAVPAACAIGAPPPGLRIYFVAAKRPAVQLSNPRQIEAYDYPPEYGPRSPVFSRAVLVQAAGIRHLHLSGTASIVGHATRHRDDIEAQLAETLANLRILLQQAGTDLAELADDALLTVYLRYPTDLDAVRARLSRVLAPTANCLFLKGDVCRSSLLIEIEGIIPVPRRAPCDPLRFDQGNPHCR